MPRRTTPQKYAGTFFALSTLLTPLLCRALPGQSPQAPNSASATGEASKQGAAASATPNDAVLWIRADSLHRMRKRLQEHPIAFAWMASSEVGAPLVRSLQELTTSLRSLALGQGLSETLVDALWTQCIELSLHRRANGEHAIAIQLDAGEHESLVQDFIDKLEASPNRENFKSIAHPFGGSGSALATFAGTRLLIASDAAAMQSCLDLLVRGKGTALAQDPAFAQCRLESDKQAFVRIFARTSESWVFEALENAGVVPSSTRSRLRTGTRAIAVQICDDSGFLQTRLSILPKKGATASLPARGKPDPRLARMIPEHFPSWIATAIDPKALVEELTKSKQDVPGLGRLGILDADLRAALPDTKLSTLAELVTPSVLYLGRNKRFPNLTGYVALVEGPRKFHAALDAVAVARKKPGSAEREIHRYASRRGGRIVYLTLIDDMLLIAESEAAEAALLERALSGKAAGAIAQRFAANDGRYCILGSDSAAARFSTVDPTDTLRLHAAAPHFDAALVQGKFVDETLVISGRSATGMLHVPVLALSPLVPTWLDTIYASRESWTLEHAAELLDAQQRYVATAQLDRDRDGKGEPEALPKLRAAGLLKSDLFTQSRGEIVAALGYRMTFVHPTELDAQEQDWAVLAWPTRPGINGDRSWFVRKDGSVWVSKALAGLDGNSGPTTKQVFGGLKWTTELSPEWKQARPPANSIANASEPAPAESSETARAGTATDDATRERPKQSTDTRAAMSAGDDKKRSDEARRLEVAGAGHDVKELQTFLKHANPEHRARAAWYLGKQKAKTAIPSLARILGEDTSRTTRLAAAKALTQMRDPKARASLARGLSDDDGSVRLLAATGLLGSKDSATLKSLLELIVTHEDDQHGDRSQAILAIQDAGAAEHLATLATLESRTKQTTDSLVYAFQQLSPKLEGEKECALLIQTLESPVAELQEYAVRRIAEARYDSATATLHAKAESASPSLRPLVDAAIASLQSPASGSASDWIAKARGFGNTMLAKLKAQPKPIQIALALTPLALLVLLLLARRSKRRARRGLSVDQVVGKTTRGSAPSLKSKEAPRKKARAGRSR